MWIVWNIHGTIYFVFTRKCDVATILRIPILRLNEFSLYKNCEAWILKFEIRLIGICSIFLPLAGQGET